jgi:glycosyltransferase involved in cell wall biosynthesis
VITASHPDQAYPRVQFVAPPPKDILEKVLRRFFFPYDESVSWVFPALRAAQELVEQIPMDAVLSTVPYLHDHIVALALKRRYGIPWIADYRDPLVGNPFRTTHGFPGMMDRFFDARFFSAADLLVAVTDRIQTEWNERCPEVAAKTAVIWNGYDPEEPIGPKAIPARPYRLISHFGSFYLGRTPIPLLSAVLRLIRQGVPEAKRLRIRFVGFLDPRVLTAHGELFEELVTGGYLELVPPVPRPRALEMMMESDSLLLADNNEAHMGHTVPAKLFEYLRIGRPILALTVPGSMVERVLRKSGVGFVAVSDELIATEFDARIREFLQMPTDPAILSPQFLGEFNGKEQAGKLAGLIDRMLDQRAGIVSPVAEPEHDLAGVR